MIPTDAVEDEATQVCSAVCGSVARLLRSDHQNWSSKTKFECAARRQKTVESRRFSADQTEDEQTWVAFVLTLNGVTHWGCSYVRWTQFWSLENFYFRPIKLINKLKLISYSLSRPIAEIKFLIPARRKNKIIKLRKVKLPMFIDRPRRLKQF